MEKANPKKLLEALPSMLNSFLSENGVKTLINSVHFNDGNQFSMSTNFEIEIHQYGSEIKIDARNNNKNGFNCFTKTYTLKK